MAAVGSELAVGGRNVQAAGRGANSRRGPAALAVLLLAGLGVAGWAQRRRPPEPRPGDLQARDCPPAPPPPGRPRLVAVVGGAMRHGERGPEETPLRAGAQVLGRARDADVHLADLTVSPRHALLEADERGRVFVRDLGALNGLSVDGIPVAEVELHDGNRLQLGDVQLIYRTDRIAGDGGRQGRAGGDDNR